MVSYLLGIFTKKIPNQFRLPKLIIFVLFLLTLLSLIVNYTSIIIVFEILIMITFGWFHNLIFYSKKKKKKTI